MSATVRSALLARHRDCPKEADRDPDRPRQPLKSAYDHGLIVREPLLGVIGCPLDWRMTPGCYAWLAVQD